MFKRIVILVAAIVLVIFLMVRRYGQLRIEFDATRFFANAQTALALPLRDKMNPEDAPIPESLKKTEGNLLPEFHTIFPQTLKKSLIDPFLPPEEAGRYLQLRYGYVTHDFWTPEVAWKANKPVWFVWSAGAARIAPDLVESATGGGERLFRFKSPPFQASNGLHSGGYLYSDSQGNRAGRIR
jgi:hypothetical protein